jgi:hypothetical protein
MAINNLPNSVIQFHKPWCLQLAFEHQQICYQYNVRLRKPSFQITKHHSYWARWHERSSLIEVSEKLITEYSWDIVIQVLKHEMAHQYVSEITKSKEAHGSEFKNACELLGVLESFKRSGGSLPEDITSQIARPENEKNRKLMFKAKKLLSLAQSENEHEATLAMKKVHEIYFKYNISEFDDCENNYDYELIYFHKKRVAATQSLIASILTEYYFVKCVFSETFDPKLIGRFKTLEILGRSENIKIARYVFSFLNERVDSLWKNYTKEVAASNSQKRSYQIGLLNGLYEKLDLQKKDLIYLNTNSSEEKQLVPVSKQLQKSTQELNSYSKTRFPKVRWSSNSNAKVNSDSYSQGLRDGNKINIYKGIENQSKDRGFFNIFKPS